MKEKNQTEAIRLLAELPKTDTYYNLLDYFITEDVNMQEAITKWNTFPKDEIDPMICQAVELHQSFMLKDEAKLKAQIQSIQVETQNHFILVSNILYLANAFNVELSPSWIDKLAQLKMEDASIQPILTSDNWRYFHPQAILEIYSKVLDFMNHFSSEEEFKSFLSQMNRSKNY